MSVKKRGSTWYYVFDAPDSTRQARKQIWRAGFATRREAQDAESQRRIEEQKRYEESGREERPDTLRSLMAAFMEHAEKKLASKTVERYRELAGYVHADLLAMKLTEVTPLHLEREWTRLLASGGHTRGTKEPRPLAEKTVRHIAGVLSSAFGRAIHWGLVQANPVSKSEPPVPRKHKGIALTPEQQELLFTMASSPWCLGMFLRMEAATGARRGEVLALRWADIVNGRAVIARSLSQTRDGLAFKSTKTDEARSVTLPGAVLTALEAHRAQQDEFRLQFGPDYARVYPGERSGFRGGRAVEATGLVPGIVSDPHTTSVRIGPPVKPDSGVLAGSSFYEPDLIFAHPDGTPLRPDSISAAVSALCKRCGLAGVSLHTLRHSHGSHLLAAGVDLPTVSERLGHSSVRVTADVYSHSIRGRDDAAAEAWQRFNERQGKEKVQ
jgi:integrase